MHLPTYPAPTQQMLRTGRANIEVSKSLSSPVAFVPGELASDLSVPPLRLPSGVVGTVDSVERIVSESSSGLVREDIVVRCSLSPNEKTESISHLGRYFQISGESFVS